MTRKVIKPDRIELKRLPDLMACRGRFTSDPGKVMLAELIEVPGKLSKTGKKKYFLGMCLCGRTWVYTDRPYAKQYIQRFLIPAIGELFGVNIKWINRWWVGRTFPGGRYYERQKALRASGTPFRS